MSILQENTLEPSALIGWCRDHERHVAVARWLVNVTDPEVCDPNVAKPDSSAVQVLLIDLRTHAPDGYFSLASRLVEQISPSYATQGEREVYRVLARCLGTGAAWPAELPIRAFSGMTARAKEAGR